MEEWYDIEEKALVELYEAVHSIGGKLSGEHGIGIKRKKYMEQMTNPVELKMMRSIKRALDPNNIMNPGKMFDMEPAEQQPE
jgi:glycolate oxidase